MKEAEIRSHHVLHVVLLAFSRVDPMLQQTGLKREGMHCIEGLLMCLHHSLDLLQRLQNLK
jgi:hypothetical protein